ncbi:Vasohibin-domain-containing protein [Chytriomyces sp. MP71]|nr:Vasohibin-domain-containing protein [Chytriomyces sp. MP71]
MQKQCPQNFETYYDSVWNTVDDLTKARGSFNKNRPELEGATMIAPASDPARRQSDKYLIIEHDSEDEVDSVSVSAGDSNKTDTRIVLPDASKVAASRQTMQRLRELVQGNRVMPSLFAIPKVPILAAFTGEQRVTNAVTAIQAYITHLGYNHFGSLFRIRKGATGRELMKVAAEILKYGLPIKCLEAVVVATFLTNDLLELDRYAITFKTICQGHVYRHIILAVKYASQWGALGLSRRSNLMDKPMEFETVDDLVSEYRRCYNGNFHEVVKVKLGGVIPHEHAGNTSFPVTF